MSGTAQEIPDPFVALCGEAIDVLNAALLGKSGQAVMGLDRVCVHEAIGKVARIVAEYVEEKQNPRLVIV